MLGELAYWFTSPGKLQQYFNPCGKPGVFFLDSY